MHGQEEQEPDSQQQEEGRLIPDPEQVSYPVQQSRNRRGDGQHQAHCQPEHGVLGLEDLSADQAHDDCDG